MENKYDFYQNDLLVSLPEKLFFVSWKKQNYFKFLNIKESRKSLLDINYELYRVHICYTDT